FSEPVIQEDCNRNMYAGFPLFERDWCTCWDGGIEQGGECKGRNDACSSADETCSIGRVCQLQDTADEDYHCECPTGTCLYPSEDCTRKAFLSTDFAEKELGECAS
ncbi:hypothetical protein PMAYCL1PPCAC_11616, partial [Pristionchus mayeri]